MWKNYRGSVLSSAAFAVARHHLWAVVADVPHLGIRFVNFHDFRFEWLQHVKRQSLRLFPVQPVIVVPRIQDDRHTWMNPTRQLVRVRGHDAKDCSQWPALSFQASHRPAKANGPRCSVRRRRAGSAISPCFGSSAVPQRQLVQLAWGPWSEVARIPLSPGAC